MGWPNAHSAVRWAGGDSSNSVSYKECGPSTESSAQGDEDQTGTSERSREPTGRSPGSEKENSQPSRTSVVLSVR